MTSLITADDFFLAAIAILRRNSVNIIPINDELDKKFSELYERVFHKNEQEAVPTFNFTVDKTHGNSRGFRETMYAARFNNLVSLENPTFHRMTIKITEDDAEFLSKHSDIADKMTGPVLAVFADEITNAKYPG
jgi:hypothetical protein